jgi:hypothetical protein
MTWRCNGRESAVIKKERSKRRLKERVARRGNKKRGISLISPFS